MQWQKGVGRVGVRVRQSQCEGQVGVVGDLAWGGREEWAEKVSDIHGVKDRWGRFLGGGGGEQ